MTNYLLIDTFNYYFTLSLIFLTELESSLLPTYGAETCRFKLSVRESFRFVLYSEDHPAVTCYIGRSWLEWFLCSFVTGLHYCACLSRLTVRHTFTVQWIHTKFKIGEKNIVKWSQRVWIHMTRGNGLKTISDLCSFNPFYNACLKNRDFLQLSYCDNDVFLPKHGMNKNMKQEYETTLTTAFLSLLLRVYREPRLTSACVAEW